MPLKALRRHGSADLSFSAPGEARFRVNIFKQRGTYAIVMRVIPTRPPNFDDFDLPPQLKEIVDIKNGIVLVTGPTGSGKSSTLAAIIDLINEPKYYHIVTIEDPIEFLHGAQELHDSSARAPFRYAKLRNRLARGSPPGSESDSGRRNA